MRPIGSVAWLSAGGGDTAAMDDPEQLPPGPRRDRMLAARPRHGPRWSQDIGRLVDAWMRSPEARRLARLRRVSTTLAEVLGDDLLDRVRPLRIERGTLVLEVADSVLLSELRNHHQHQILAALTQGGTGVTCLAFRLARGTTEGPWQP